jgi:hypothetical protein
MKKKQPTPRLRHFRDSFAAAPAKALEQRVKSRLAQFSADVDCARAVRPSDTPPRTEM